MCQIHPQTNKVLLLITLIAVGFASYGQAPSLLNYQAIARNTNGNSLPNQSMNIRISIINNSPSGDLLYSEIRAIKTNLVGLFSLIIGSTGAMSYRGTTELAPNFAKSAGFSTCACSMRQRKSFLPFNTLAYTFKISLFAESPMAWVHI